MDNRLTIAAESFLPGRGGIARVARLMAKVIDEEASAGRLQGLAIALTGSAPAFSSHLPLTPCYGSRLRFCFHVQRSVFGSSHFVYDFLGMARAHPLLFGSMRPSLSFIHGVEVWEGAHSKRFRAAERMTCLLANSLYTRDRAASYRQSLSRAKICWLGTETDTPAPTSVDPSRRPTVLILGRVDTTLYKGHAELVACWPQVVSAVPSARLLIVGDGPGLISLKDQASASRAAQHIHFRGWVPDDALPAIWNEASIFAMPSRGEGFGLVYIEAMRHGLPVIASVHDAAPEINLDGHTGYNVNLDAPGDLPERLIHLLRNPDHIATLGQNARRRWHDHFRYSAFRERFLPLFYEFLSS
jgi:phosphatidylinositol alpha-1,6-mannosyltransferase